MFYHVVIELAAGFYKNHFDKFEYKKDITDPLFLLTRFVDPYHFGESIINDGKTFAPHAIERMQIFASERPADAIRLEQQRFADANPSMLPYRNDLLTGLRKQLNVTDVYILYPKGSQTRNEKAELKSNIEINIESQLSESKPKPSKVFIVHGHDDSLIHEVQAFLAQQNITAIVLREQSHASMTIIEKLELCIQDQSIGFGMVLYTPDDEGRCYGDKAFKRRARQNVVFEHGLLFGALGRSKVASLVKVDSSGDIELPGDVAGVVYTGHGHGDWRLSIAHMLGDSGFEIDYKKIRA